MKLRLISSCRCSTSSMLAYSPSPPVTPCATRLTYSSDLSRWLMISERIPYSLGAVWSSPGPILRHFMSFCIWIRAVVPFRGPAVGGRTRSLPFAIILSKGSDKRYEYVNREEV
jgi:hypothetical protein